jgi:CHAT domain-containing protein
MTREELAARLSAADTAEQTALLKEHTDLLDPELASALKSLLYDARDNNPLLARGAAIALKQVANLTRDAEVIAVAIWMEGIVALELDGHAEEAVAKLDEAANRFNALEQSLQVASVQVGKLYALALLGRYNEALECGLGARDVFLAHGDMLSTGKIEKNIGNLYYRRDRYQEAEHFYRAALARFEAAGDERMTVLIDTNLATALIYQHKFRDAEALYHQALTRAESAGLTVMQAIIECDLGCLALFRGRYNQALDYLERSRRRYVALGMEHESAIAEQELADAYLELNLAPEAAAIYTRVIPTFAELGMRAEQSRALSSHARASLLLGRVKESRSLLAEARALYKAEGNQVGEAMVALTEAQLYHSEKNYSAAAASALRAEAPLLEAGSWERFLLARWLRGESARACGSEPSARTLFESTLHDSKLRSLPQIAQRCHTSLGLLAATAGDTHSAESHLKKAIRLIEELRLLLPSDEFRTAFVADKLIPYKEIARLCLEDKSRDRATEALIYIERARSRALLEMLGGSLQTRLRPRDEFEAEEIARLQEMREELNWFYTQLNRPPTMEAKQAQATRSIMVEAVRERESRMLEMFRHIEQTSESAMRLVEPLDITRLQNELGHDTALVEYFALDGELMAFVVTDEGVEAIRHIGCEAETNALIERLRFQINSLRFGSKQIRKHMDQITERARHYLGLLYDTLLRPVEDHIGQRRLIVVPHRALHYVPFHALYDGAQHVIEQREVCYTPAASVLLQCLDAPRRSMHRALMLAVSDESAPKVIDEVRAIAPLFDEAVALVEDEATIKALNTNASSADVVHFACHGQFRADNPLFSSLRLADGWLAVRDASALDLRCELVTLSACETGTSAVAPGEELIGLARGFFAAGAPTLLATLWTVADEESSQLMTDFYTHLLAGMSPSAALRAAQCAMLQYQPHPFFWSPFVLMGRW